MYKYGRLYSNNLFNLYFTERSEYVSVKESKSSTLPINVGTPLGYVLLPLLFRFFFDDTVNKYSRSGSQFMC